MIHEYVNGNYTVRIDDVSGTKERITEDDAFIAEFPESIDCTITTKCDGGCKFCYMGCTADGKHADLDSSYMNDVFLPSLKPYTELALNGNDLSHPQLMQFLEKLRKIDVIANLTVNQKHFLEKYDLIRQLYEGGLIHGVGVSLVSPTAELIEKMQVIPTSILHVIVGLFSEEDIAALSYHGLKLLMLGYKHKGRGTLYFDSNAEMIKTRTAQLRNILPTLLHRKVFDLVSLDNLALEQLNIRSMLTEEQWNSFYMGDDGSFTFYIDLVNHTYARDSLIPINHPIEHKSVVEMFSDIRNLNHADSSVQ